MQVSLLPLSSRFHGIKAGTAYLFISAAVCVVIFLFHPDTSDHASEYALLATLCCTTAFQTVKCVLSLTGVNIALFLGFSV